jgi:hypothetical protein
MLRIAGRTLHRVRDTCSLTLARNHDSTLAVQN